MEQNYNCKQNYAIPLKNSYWNHQTYHGEASTRIVFAAVTQGLALLIDILLWPCALLHPEKWSLKARADTQGVLMDVTAVQKRSS